MSGLYRKVRSVSFNPEEEEAIETLMSFGGYTNFSEFAKAKILGVASEGEKRLREVETAIDNMRQANERHHQQWVDTAKRLSGADTEPLMAATYALLHMMAKPQDRAAMANDVDMKLVEITLKGESNSYRKFK